MANTSCPYVLKSKYDIIDLFSFTKLCEEKVNLEKCKENATTGIVTIEYDNKKHSFRAYSNDGIHGKANVSFPNDLRIPNSQYEVEKLIWTGKFYRVTGYINRLNKED